MKYQNQNYENVMQVLEKGKELNIHKAENCKIMRVEGFQNRVHVETTVMRKIKF